MLMQNKVICMPGVRLPAPGRPVVAGADRPCGVHLESRPNQRRGSLQAPTPLSVPGQLSAWRGAAGRWPAERGSDRLRER